MTVTASPSIRRAATADRRIVVTALGITQILAWGSTYYLLAVLAKPIAADTGWPLPWIVGGLSLGMLIQGVVSPYVGDAIGRFGGRPVLSASAALLATGLFGLATAPDLAVYVAAWLVLGVGMAAGLYEAAFSALGRLYGHGARQPITVLTLFGGFASTVCWPLSAFLAGALGWRGTCLIYAGLQVTLALPVYLLALPRETGRTAVPAPTAIEPPAGGGPRRGPGSHRRLFVVMATCFTIGAATASLLSVHLLNLLQARQISLAAAVGLGALVGPSQVGARVIEMLFGTRTHPSLTMMVSAILTLAGVTLLWAGIPAVALAVVLYGAGMGIKSIARGTLPLAVFGADRYPSLMGRLAMPGLVAGAAAPSLGAFLIDRMGATGALGVLAAAALANVGLASLLAGLVRLDRRGKT